MANEEQWIEDRQRFVASAAGVSDEAVELVELSRGVADGPDGRGGIGPLAEEFVALSRAFLLQDTVGGVLEQLVRAAVELVPGADLASVTVQLGSGHFSTPAETAALATRLDELQYRSGEGPCVEATRSPGMGMASSADLGAGREWPAFGPAAAAAGAHSVLATGLFGIGDEQRLGALNLYSYEVNGLDRADRDIALLLAAHASVALAATDARTAAELREAHLRRALDSRDVIGQAKGILMERRGVAADEAFDILRRTSQRLNVKLADVAARLIGQGGGGGRG